MTYIRKALKWARPFTTVGRTVFFSMAVTAICSLWFSPVLQPLASKFLKWFAKCIRVLEQTQRYDF
jgi:hypothetical protein